MSHTESQKPDVLNLLEELHRKKRWLDVVIAGLEGVIASPEIRFVLELEKTFNDGQVPCADIPLESATRLSTLAAKVPRRQSQGARRRRERSMGKQAESEAAVKKKGQNQLTSRLIA